ncbi:MAG: cytochrome c [Xanthobacteraceae bacterium]
MRAPAILTVIVSVASAHPSPALTADTAAGKELAQRWCAVCHLVAPDQERAPTVAPPFASIGKKPGFNADQVAKSMLAPHPQMPGRELSRDQAADIAAYIATLAK